MPVKWHVDLDDGIKGERIILQARRITSPRDVSGASGRHGALFAVARVNAMAWIEQPYAPGGKLKLE